MTDEQVVATATDTFYAALNTMFIGDGQPIKDLWSRSKDVTYMGPNGQYLVGWEKIEQEWTIRPQQIHIVVGADIAVMNCIESGENLVNGKKETVQIRSSTVFRKEVGAWKVIGHQTDPLKHMNNPK